MERKTAKFRNIFEHIFPEKEKSSYPLPNSADHLLILPL